MADSCGNCRFFKMNPGNPNVGVCRAMSPVAMKVDRPSAGGGATPSFEIIAPFPPVEVDDWCRIYSVGVAP